MRSFIIAISYDKPYIALCSNHVHSCICSSGITSSRPPASVWPHMTQPIYIARHCLTDHRERKVILDLQRGIETDLGWALQYRVQQLVEERGWLISERSRNVLMIHPTERGVRKLVLCRYHLCEIEQRGFSAMFSKCSRAIRKLLACPSIHVHHAISCLSIP